MEAAHEIMKSERTDNSKSIEPQSRPSWDEYFMFIAKTVASRSTCLSRPVGAILVLNRQILVTGYNGSMPGDLHCLDEKVCFKREIQDCRHDKYDFCRASHAEANMLAQAARKGIAVDESTIYTTLMPCYTCTKQLAVAGIREVVYEHIYESLDPERDKHWREAIESRMVFRKLEISSRTMNLILDGFITKTTSLRRLEPT